MEEVYLIWLYRRSTLLKERLRKQLGVRYHRPSTPILLIVRQASRSFHSELGLAVCVEKDQTGVTWNKSHFLEFRWEKTLEHVLFWPDCGAIHLICCFWLRISGSILFNVRWLIWFHQIATSDNGCLPSCCRSCCRACLAPWPNLAHFQASSGLLGSSNRGWLRIVFV